MKPATATFIARTIADALHVHLLQCKDGGPAMLIFSKRPLCEGVTDLFRNAIRNGKPVPTVLGRRRSTIVQL